MPLFFLLTGALETQLSACSGGGDDDDYHGPIYPNSGRDEGTGLTSPDDVPVLGDAGGSDAPAPDLDAAAPDDGGTDAGSGDVDAGAGEQLETVFHDEFEGETLSAVWSYAEGLSVKDGKLVVNPGAEGHAMLSVNLSSHSRMAVAATIAEMAPEAEAAVEFGARLQSADGDEFYRAWLGVTADGLLLTIQRAPDEGTFNQTKLTLPPEGSFAGYTVRLDLDGGKLNLGLLDPAGQLVKDVIFMDNPALAGPYVSVKLRGAAATPTALESFTVSAAASP